MLNRFINKVSTNASENYQFVQTQCVTFVSFQAVTREILDTCTY